MSQQKPGVGVGIIILNKQGQVLVGKRIGSHAQKYSIFGGGLEAGETFEQAAIREAQEELGITIHDPQFVCVTNNLETYREDGIHNISVIMVADDYAGTPTIMEPHKCAELVWSDLRALPEPHFDASRLGVQSYLEHKPYIQVV